MKKLMTLVLASMLALFISACATSKSSDEHKVTCPTCGYEFDTTAD